MLPFPEREFTAQERAILTRAPFLGTFIDIKLAQSKPREWGTRMATLDHPLRQSLEDKLTPAGYHAAKVASGYVIRSLRIVDRERAPDAPYQLADTLLKIGFEVGDGNDLEPFHQRIYMAAAALGMITAEAVLRVGAGIDSSPSVLRAITLAGGYIASMETQSSEPGEDPFKLFKDFLDGPEYKGPNL
jgi:hypothetical protein